MSELRDLNQATLRANMCRKFTSFGTNACAICKAKCEHGTEWLRRIDAYGEPITDAEAAAKELEKKPAQAVQIAPRGRPKKPAEQLASPKQLPRFENKPDPGAFDSEGVPDGVLPGFHVLVKRYIRDNGITRSELQRRSCVNFATISEICNGYSDGSRTTQNRIMEAMGAAPEAVWQEILELRRKGVNVDRVKRGAVPVKRGRIPKTKKEDDPVTKPKDPSATSSSGSGAPAGKAEITKSDKVPDTIEMLKHSYEEANAQQREIETQKYELQSLMKEIARLKGMIEAYKDVKDNLIRALIKSGE